MNWQLRYALPDRNFYFRALGENYMGKQVGSELVEMHEGALPYKDVSSYFFDDEGTLA